MVYETKTKETDIAVSAFLDTVTDMEQRDDAHKIIDMMQRLSGHSPKMWGPSIIGFGRYHYTYDSGHQGDSCRIGFSPRKSNTVFYIANGFTAYAGLIAKLGKHKAGKSCLYVKHLSDIDEAKLEELCSKSLDHMQERYPAIAPG